MAKKAKKLKKKLNKAIDRLIPLFITIMVVFPMLFPQVVLAQHDIKIEIIERPSNDKITKIETEPDWNYSIKLPEIDNRKAKHVVHITVTAYNSLPEQTDSTPCITASGMDICEHNMENIIATNFWNLPFGAKVRFPDLFGDKVFTVEDRMNKRYYNRADIWMKEYNDAKLFGVKRTKMEILF